MRRTMALVLAALASASVAATEDAWRDGRIRSLEPGVTLQRATEPGAEEAMPNLPFLPGDRVWTDGSGRVEFQFADGSVLRLDSRSKLDYLSREDGRDGRLGFKLWSGGLIVRTRDSRDAPAFEIEVPGGLAYFDERGVYRLDIEQGETRVSVLEGEATLESGGRRVRLEAGERSYASRSGPERAQRFDPRESDEFARWDAEREERDAWASNSRRHLPEDVAPYASELDQNGSWYYEAEAGYVWRPSVRAGWRPYCDGRWVWTPYGWTWVAAEPWGWAVSHYGRWGHSPALGWYWIPSTGWGPAWVSWSVGTGFVGWCPLGRHNRPALAYQDPRDRHAVLRGSPAEAWSHVRPGDFTARDLGRRQIMIRSDDAAQARRLEPGQARLGRDLRVSEGRAVPRASGRIGPSIGDTVPELRTDPATTIPSPVLRRPPVREDGGRRFDEEATERSTPRHPTDSRSPRTRTPPAWDADAPSYRGQAPEVRTPVQRTPQARTPEDRGARRRDDERVRPAERPDPGHEVMRQFFRPLEGSPPAAQPREERRRDDSRRQPQAEEARPRHRDDAPPSSVRPRTEPRHEAPRAQSPPPREQPKPRNEDHARPRKEKP